MNAYWLGLDDNARDSASTRRPPADCGSGPVQGLPRALAVPRQPLPGPVLPRRPDDRGPGDRQRAVVGNPGVDRGHRRPPAAPGAGEAGRRRIRRHRPRGRIRPRPARRRGRHRRRPPLRHRSDRGPGAADDPRGPAGPGRRGGPGAREGVRRRGVPVDPVRRRPVVVPPTGLPPWCRATSAGRSSRAPRPTAGRSAATTPPCTGPTSAVPSSAWPRSGPAHRRGVRRRVVRGGRHLPGRRRPEPVPVRQCRRRRGRGPVHDRRRGGAVLPDAARAMVAQLSWYDAAGRCRGQSGGSRTGCPAGAGTPRLVRAPTPGRDRWPGPTALTPRPQAQSGDFGASRCRIPNSGSSWARSTS